MLENIQKEEEGENKKEPIDTISLETEEEVSKKEVVLNYEIKTNEVYYKGVLIDGADPETFKHVVSTSADFYVDKYHLYIGITPIINNVDVETFKFVGVQDTETYFKDKDNVYGFGEKSRPITGASPADCIAENLDGCKGLE